VQSCCLWWIIQSIEMSTVKSSNYLYMPSSTNNQKVSMADWIYVCQYVCEITFKTEASQKMIKALRPWTVDSETFQQYLTLSAICTRDSRLISWQLWHEIKTTAKQTNYRVHLKSKYLSFRAAYLCGLW
jgi:hypothetical protein